MGKLRKRLDSGSSDSSAASADGFSSSSSNDLMKPRKKRRMEGSKPQNGLPKEATMQMYIWLYKHRHDPYPDEATKLNLQRDTGLSANQVSNFFINARRRQVPNWLVIEGKSGEQIQEILKRRGHGIKKKDFNRIRRPPNPGPGLNSEEVIAFMQANVKGCDIEKLPENFARQLYQSYFDNVYARNPANSCNSAAKLDNVLRPKSNSCSSIYTHHKMPSFTSVDKENVNFNTPEISSLSEYSSELDSDYYTNSSVPHTPSPPSSSHSSLSPKYDAPDVLSYNGYNGLEILAAVAASQYPFCLTSRLK